MERPLDDVPGQANDYEYCLFRKTLNIAAKPANYIVKVSVITVINYL